MMRHTLAFLLTALALPLAACGAPGWAKDEPLEHHIPPLGQLPELPTSYFPPPPEESTEVAPPHAPVPAPAPVPVPAPAPQPAPTVTVTRQEPPPPPPPARDDSIRIEIPDFLLP